MMPHQEDIARYLVSQGIGTLGGVLDWGIHVNIEPAQPDRVITVYATPGEPPDTDELDLLRTAFQVRARSGRLSDVVDVYQEAYEKMEAVRDLLIIPRVSLVTANSTFYAIFATSEIIPIGRDQLDRHLIVANYMALRQKA